MATRRARRRWSTTCCGLRHRARLVQGCGEVRVHLRDRAGRLVRVASTWTSDVRCEQQNGLTRAHHWSVTWPRSGLAPAAVTCRRRGIRRPRWRSSGSRGVRCCVRRLLGRLPAFKGGPTTAPTVADTVALPLCRLEGGALALGQAFSSRREGAAGPDFSAFLSLGRRHAW